jgi:hypothetical protein
VAAYSAARPAWHLTLPWFAVNDPAARVPLKSGGDQIEKCSRIDGDGG